MAISQNPEIMRYVYGDLMDRANQEPTDEEVGISDMDYQRSRRQKHMAQGQAGGTAVGAGVGAAVGAPMAGAAIGGAVGGLGGANFQEWFEEPWKEGEWYDKVGLLAAPGLYGPLRKGLTSDKVSEKVDSLGKKIKKLNPF